MAANDTTSNKDAQTRIRATAIKHAISIEERKTMANQVSDLILRAYDIPANPNADPAQPSHEDVTLFQECLRLFRPADLDELVAERNIDERCGYALCPKPRRKIPGAGIKTWNRKGGKEFKLLNTADLEKWCTDLCGDRNVFVRAQLSSEPAWMRETQNNVRLLDEVRRTESVTTLAAMVSALSIGHDEQDETSKRLAKLANERAQSQVDESFSQLSIVEKDTDSQQTRPPNAGSVENIEGHQTRKVRFIT